MFPTVLLLIGVLLSHVLASLVLESELQVVVLDGEVKALSPLNRVKDVILRQVAFLVVVQFHVPFHQTLHFLVFFVGFRLCPITCYFLAIGVGHLQLLQNVVQVILKVVHLILDLVICCLALNLAFVLVY